MLLGHKDLIAPELQEAFSRAGISHLLAVSGLHMGFVLAMALPFIARVQGPAGTAGRWARRPAVGGVRPPGRDGPGLCRVDRRAGLCRPGVASWPWWALGRARWAGRWTRGTPWAWRGRPFWLTSPCSRWTSGFRCPFSP